MVDLRRKCNYQLIRAYRHRRATTERRFPRRTQHKAFQFISKLQDLVRLTRKYSDESI
jgi:hypothetical protein